MITEPSAAPEFVIHEVPVPSGAADPVHPLEAAYHALRLTYDLATYGHNDFNESLTSFHAGSVPTDYKRNRRWVVLPAGVEPNAAPADAAVGLAVVNLSLVDHTHLAFVQCYVHPAHCGKGLGRRLVETLHCAGTEAGRSTFQVWLSTRDLGGGGPRIPAKSGTGSVPTDDPGTRLLHALGFELEQVEAQSTLEVPADGQQFAETIGRWREDATAAAGAEYRTVSWIGVTPPEHRAEMVRLRRGMSVDIPSAGLDFEEEAWTEERVVHQDERSARMGFQLAYTVAIHEPTGAIAAYMYAEWPLDRPAGVWQFDTYVDREHLGHRLGMLIKAVNLRQLLEENPATERIHTWNAGENSHMLAINTEMGFTPRSVEGAWEKRLG